jgi:signal transduction histidine kinase
MSLTPEQEQELKEFLGKLTHGLRSPLASIVGYSELILMDEEANLSADVRQDVEAINMNCNIMQEIIEKIQEYQHLFD